jgi:hypothetical protein
MAPKLPEQPAGGQDLESPSWTFNNLINGSMLLNDEKLWADLGVAEPLVDDNYGWVLSVCVSIMTLLCFFDGPMIEMCSLKATSA